MEWTWKQLLPILKANWRLIPILAVAVPVAFLAFGPVAAAGLILVGATLVLAWVTWGLARANQSSASHSKRAEIREALKAAQDFIIIKRDEFGDTLKGDKRHIYLDLIETLASYVNCLQPKTRQDLQDFAAKIDRLRIDEKMPDIVGLTNDLVKLQSGVVEEMKAMREDLLRNPW